MGLPDDKTWRKHLRIVVPSGRMDTAVKNILTRNSISFIGSIDPAPGLYNSYECDIDSYTIKKLLAEAPEYNGSLKFDVVTNLIA